MASAGFYVYEHLRADTGEVFYVGKGSGHRARCRQGRNPYWRAVANKHGYVTREPDPTDRRAKRVVPTARGADVVAIAQSTVPAIEDALRALLGADRWEQLRTDLRIVADAAGAIGASIAADARPR